MQKEFIEKSIPKTCLICLSEIEAWGNVWETED